MPDVAPAYPRTYTIGSLSMTPPGCGNPRVSARPSVCQSLFVNPELGEVTLRPRPTYPRAMDSAVPAPAPPAATIDEVIARMRSIDAALPASDGVACFNRMYLEVTTGVSQQVEQGSFGDADFVAHLDVVFANLYFRAVDALSGPASDLPVAWQPLLSARTTHGIEPI